jgi:uncharacterized protein YcnI
MTIRRTAIASVLVPILVVLVPSWASAHVSVLPRESAAGAEETYTVRVPTEGAVATTRVEIEVPDGVVVLEVIPQVGVKFETTMQSGRIVAITWSKDIPPKESAQFQFRARNPSGEVLIWRAHQHFADGTRTDWVGAPGEGRPAARTTLRVR